MQVLKESVRNAIVEGAILEFFEYGFQNANMRRIADRANITVGNIYRYYRNKETLFKEILLPAERAIDDLESFDQLLNITSVKSMDNVNQIVTFVMSVLKPYTREIFIITSDPSSPHYQKIKGKLENVIINKANKYYPKMFDRYFLKILASSFVQSFFTTLRDNINNIRRVQDVLAQMIIFYFRDVENRFF
ncbi:MAG: helix-turn-helix domain containing protein [Candidatus Izemoplasmatales bacterium]|nr:helix-turn-helix domain containing protein [Candidatus Izemoplasmatales bacterium]MDD4069349.1 helix-turn-helix domain containing protein [Candidatus Izemoplasmatales bacterium]MDY0139361.1 helix-turn-helix domain-containing protein [Candidatus Izemoplasmatales bacterium]